jgi:hypothetical protein
MTSYIARTGGQKKKNSLHQKELELQAGIRRQESVAKIQRRAEKVRSAHQGVLKALLKEAEPMKAEDKEKSKNTRMKLAVEKEFWDNVVTDEIIRIYSKLGDENHHIDRKKWWDFRSKRL